MSDWTACIRENKFSMFSENITCAFKNKGFFIKLEIKFEWLYYLEATKRVEVVVRIKEMPSPFPCIPVICEWLWKKTQIEKKIRKYQKNVKAS